MELSYQVDQAGNRTRITWPDSLYVQYAYDAVNRATTVYENGSTHLGTYSYDTLGRRATLSRGNGTSTTFSYDSASRLSGLAHDLASTGNDQTFTLSPYNPASQLLARTATNNAYAWSQPTVSATYVRNGLNQYTSVGGTSYSYSDGRGNLTSDGSRTFAYDVENRLTSVGGSASLTLTYDPLGRLKHVTGGSTTQFLYDGDRLSAEYNTSGTVLRRYVHGPGVDEPIVWYEGSSTSDRRWLHSDERGSVIAHSDGSGVGTLYKYGSYGEPDSWTGSRFRYTGQIMLQGSGVELYHYKARVYDPKIGRFLQTDPVGYGDNNNLYAYVNNDPVGKSDPTGLCESKTGLEWLKCKFFGNPQKTGTPGHDTTSERIGKEYAKNGAKEVHYDRALSKVTGDPKAPRRRPDVTAVQPDGRIDTTEVRSNSQTTAEMDAKGKQMQNGLKPTMRGKHQTVSVDPVKPNVSAKAIKGVGALGAVLGLYDALTSSDAGSMEFLYRMSGTYDVAVAAGVLPPPPEELQGT